MAGKNAASKSTVSAPAERLPAAPEPDKDVSLGDLPNQLGFLVRRLQLWVFREFTRKLAAFEITPPQYSVLVVVGANPGINQLAVASALTIERAGLGRLIERLEARGLLQRRPSTVDRRSYVLHLTPHGRSSLAEMSASVYEVERRLAEKLGPDEFEHFRRRLSAFHDD